MLCTKNISVLNLIKLSFSKLLLIINRDRLNNLNRSTFSLYFSKLSFFIFLMDPSHLSIIRFFLTTPSLTKDFVCSKKLSLLLTSFLQILILKKKIHAFMNFRFSYIVHLVVAVVVGC